MRSYPVTFGEVLIIRVTRSCLVVSEWHLRWYCEECFFRVSSLPLKVLWPQQSLTQLTASQYMLSPTPDPWESLKTLHCPYTVSHQVPMGFLPVTISGILISSPIPFPPPGNSHFLSNPIRTTRIQVLIFFQTIITENLGTSLLSASFLPSYVTSLHKGLNCPPWPAGQLHSP